MLAGLVPFAVFERILAFSGGHLYIFLGLWSLPPSSKHIIPTSAFVITSPFQLPSLTLPSSSKDIIPTFRAPLSSDNSG